ncbi:MAG: class I SAM-dependent methyltransferase [Chloroflexi bacterium]|nr:class I SAM-dependent methyltransferase [Chloroflexota bacterium]
MVSDRGLASLEKTTYGGTRTDVERFIPANARRILDVGCARGELGLALKGRGAAVHVTGVEMSAVLAEEASRRLDRVLVGTIEAVVPELPDGAFDCIVFADVLEHLINPHQLLADIRPKLDSPGLIVASVPNVRHHRVIRRLLFGGRWRYCESGLLDSGHLRFFALADILDMFAWAGYRATAAGANRVGLRRTWFSTRRVGGPLTSFVDHQYLITAVPDWQSGPARGPWWSTSGCI